MIDSSFPQLVLFQNACYKKISVERLCSLNLSFVEISEQLVFFR